MSSFSSQNLKSPVSEGSSKLKWNPTRDKYLTELLVEHQRAGKKKDTSWMPEAWTAIARAFSKKVGFEVTVKQLKARQQVLRTSYMILKKCINHSGFSWNNELQMLKASNNFWDDYIKEVPKAKMFRHSRVALYEQWYEIFEGNMEDNKKQQPIIPIPLPPVSEIGDNRVRLQYRPSSPDDEDSSSNLNVGGSSSGCKKRLTNKKPSLVKESKDPLSLLAEAIKGVTASTVTNARLPAHVAFEYCLDIVMKMHVLSITEKIRAAELLKDEMNAIMFIKFSDECRLEWIKMQLGKS